MTRIIADLFKNYPIIKSQGNLNLTIANIQIDSRKVKAEDLFVAIVGLKIDAHKFLPQIVAKKVKAIVVQADKLKNLNLAHLFPNLIIIEVDNTRKCLAYLASAFYDFPTLKFNLIGVTGTNGKTTVTNLIKEIFQFQKYKTGLIGTIENQIGNVKFTGERTTPDALELQKIFFKMVEAGVQQVSMEVSSHALSLYRVENCHFQTAVFTNLTQDHLDYHQTMKNYFQAKEKLFQMATKQVLNLDDSYGQILNNKFSNSLKITYGINPLNNPDILATEIKTSLKGLSFKVNYQHQKLEFNLNLIGKFNIYNALAAIGVGILNEFTLEEIKLALEKIKGIKGRFQLINNEKNPISVIVDYAHTPDGLENILKTAQMIEDKGKIITIFGCGGDRDTTKRPVMGKISTDYSDLTILTSDNPRTENPLKIIKQIEEGAKQGKHSYQIIENRKEAIQLAIKQAKIGDLIIIAGKGHEDYQIFKDKTIHFSDIEVAQECLKNF